MSQQAEVDIDLYTGSAKRLQFTFTSGGAAWDGMDGATSIELNVKRSLDEETILFSVDYDEEESDLPGGIVQFFIGSHQTALLTENAVYDVKVLLGDYEDFVPVFGDVNVQKNVG